MTKKKIPAKRLSKPAKSQKVETHSAKTTTGETRAEPQLDPFEGRLYTTSAWKGMPNYECRFCAFATVDHEAALEHAADVHAPPEPPKPTIINTGLVSEDGAPITRAVEPAKED